MRFRDLRVVVWTPSESRTSAMAEPMDDTGHHDRSLNEAPSQTQPSNTVTGERTRTQTSIDPTNETRHRPSTATPSLQTLESVDSALGSEQYDSSTNHMDTTNAQEIINHTGAVHPDSAQAFNLTEVQQQGLQDAVNSGQLAEEQVLAIDVRRVPSCPRRRTHFSTAQCLPICA